MARLIDADALKVAVRKKFKDLPSRCEINGLVNAAPTVDAIPVEWLVNLKNEYAREGHEQAEGDLINLLLMWQKEQEAR